MSLMRWNGMVDPFEEMEELMQRLPALHREHAMQRAFTPAMDVYETKDNVVIETPLAGVDPKNVHVSVEKGVLTVQGEMKKEHEVEDKNYYRKEIRTGSFFRQVALPAPVKDDAVTAEFADGVLKITCPKTAPTQAKKIEVKVMKKENGKK